MTRLENGAHKQTRAPCPFPPPPFHWGSGKRPRVTIRRSEAADVPHVTLTYARFGPRAGHVAPDSHSHSHHDRNPHELLYIAGFEIRFRSFVSPPFHHS
ncbi:hypothetical protein AG1IA_09794 [Rhizoctonia solani AG-1 IA]|uniref:Uncharacterized protein n=1 Tax=Thanatephorus cucumeris (strain AG1-IA) TaxID=983506 RepID=L8WDB7_THACA|nr:hypothetical protein AG1IA_09794 [Rhizoctonia solani AG-1 IA]